VLKSVGKIAAERRNVYSSTVYHFVLFPKRAKCSAFRSFRERRGNEGRFSSIEISCLRHFPNRLRSRLIRNRCVR